ncbi:12872_t:CDS:2, partial [Dentiscutata heterogama]
RNPKWKYCGKIEAKSENIFKAKNAVKPPEEDKEDPKKKEYIGGPIKIKINSDEKEKQIDVYSQNEAKK